MLTNWRDAGPGAIKGAIAAWQTHEADELVLTEMSIEAWVRYASLCREAQSAGPLRVSVAGKVDLYRQLQDKFMKGTPEERAAVASLGPVWQSVRDRWGAADYERQQAWMQAAPLPPPMEADSVGYATALFSGNLPRQLHSGD